jgi:hypothetical protein
VFLVRSVLSNRYLIENAAKVNLHVSYREQLRWLFVVLRQDLSGIHKNDSCFQNKLGMNSVFTDKLYMIYDCHF